MSIPTISAGWVIVYNDDGIFKILLITTHNWLLALPKWHAEEGETIEQTAIREMKEEIWLKQCFIKKSLWIIVRIWTEHDWNKKEKHIHIFSMSWSWFSNIHEENFVWIDIIKAIWLMMYKEESNFLIKHLNEIKKFAVSIEDLYIPYYWKKIYSMYDWWDILEEVININNLSINFNNIVAFCYKSKKISFKSWLLQISDFTNNLILNDLPDNIQCFFAYNSMELSNTKIFFTINTIIRKLVIWWYIIISSDILAIWDWQIKDIGGWLVQINGKEIKQLRNQSVINDILERLKLQCIYITKKINWKNVQCIVLQKLKDYVY